MGMDVYGKDYDSTLDQFGEPVGKYFRNSVWGWHPLWNYCEAVARDLIPDGNSGHYNDGWGLDARDSLQLGLRLKRLIAEGKTARYAAEYDAKIAAIPQDKCRFCYRGKTTKKVAKQYPAYKQYVGQTCIQCKGTGFVDPIDKAYPFDVENVAEFAEFCIHSGGFEIC